MAVGEPFERVLSAAQADAPWAFERLYRSLSPAVCGYLRLRGAADPEDLTSEVFLGAFRRIGSFSGAEDQFRAWVFTIAHRRLTDEWRALGCRPRLADAPLPDRPGGDVEEEALRRLSAERVRSLCAGLAPDQADVLLLRLISGLTVDAVAGILGKTPGAVKALQRRGVAAIRRQLEREGVPLGLAGGAAGVLPGPAQSLVATAVNAATPFEFPDGGDAAGTLERVVPALPDVDVTVPQVSPLAVPAQPPVSVTAGAKAGSTSTSGSAKTNAGAAAPTVPNVNVASIPQPTVPPAVAGLVSGLPACVKNLIPSGGAVPDPTKLAAQIPACIPQVLAASGLPPQVAACISSVLGTIGSANGMNPASVPGISAVDLSSCVPMDASKCVSSMMSFLAAMPSFTGGFTGMTGIPGMNSIPGLSSVSGCAPMDVSKCITSITSSVTPGTTPKLDLSGCMPTTAPTLAGALSFFGK